MDLSKSYNQLTCSHSEAMDLAKKPEWYHRRPPGCSTDITSSYKTRASSSSFNSLSAQPGAPVRCRDMERGSEALGDYMNSTRVSGLDLYNDRVHGDLWHPSFYGPDQRSAPVPESSGGDESDSASDVIFLVSSANEPLLCSPFIQDNLRHIVEPLSPAASSLDEERGCYHLPQPLSSPSPDSSYSEESSESSVDIPVHHTRPVVLLSDLSTVCGNHVESPLDISSDDSDVIEVSVTNGTFPSTKKGPLNNSLVRESSPQSEIEKASLKKVRRSTRVRRSSCMSDMPQFTCGVNRHSLRRQVKNHAVGIYNENLDSDDMMEYAAKLSSPEVDESVSHSNVSKEASSNPEESDVEIKTKRRSPQRAKHPLPKTLCTKSIKRRKPHDIHETKNLRTSKQEQKHRTTPRQEQKASSRRRASVNKKTTTKRKRKRPTPTGPSPLFSPREPEIKLKYANLKDTKKEKKCDRFCPFVHMNHTVINYPEEEVTVRSSRGEQLQTGARSLSGFVPNTSCFQLGRLSPEGRGQAALWCSLCGQTANAMGLGDLHGPYHPTGPSVDCQNSRAERKDEDNRQELANGHLVNCSDGGCDALDSSLAVRCLCNINNNSLPKVPLRMLECWIHEDCGIWSPGVFLVRGKLYGLQEAARLAQETVCSTCQQTGAIMGCFQKGCPRNYHYRCAIQSEQTTYKCNQTTQEMTRKHAEALEKDPRISSGCDNTCYVCVRSGRRKNFWEDCTCHNKRIKPGDI